MCGILCPFFGAIADASQKVGLDIDLQAEMPFHPLGLRFAQIWVSRWSKGGYSVEYTDSLTLFEFINDYVLISSMVNKEAEEIKNNSK